MEFLVIFAIAFLVGLLFFAYAIGFTSIGTAEVGIVEKWWSAKGSVDADGLIALNNEAGFQPNVLRAGVHFKTPLKYKVTKVRLVTIPQGQLAYIFARSGEPLENGQTLGRLVPEGKSFQDVQGFLTNGGQKGPQRQILREGTYAFNLAQFIVITKDKVHSLFTTKEELQQIETMRSELAKVNGFQPVVVGSSHEAYDTADVGDSGAVAGSQVSASSPGTTSGRDTIGIVTVNEGPTPDGGAIIAPIVGEGVDSKFYHNNFQDPEKFLLAGGRKGKQLQVLTDGVYFINRLFASVAIEDKTVIAIGMAGVVVSYFGEQGTDISGTDYSHGELVAQGSKGIWERALLPGKYAFNTYAGSVLQVPTTNVILKWISGQTGAHKYDDNLREISLITKDAFEPNLPLTCVFNIDYRKASSVIQRFGNIKTLIEQSLDPMISGYFKNIGQTKTLIELVQARSDIQNQASAEMKAKFDSYDLELKEVLIGTPSASANDQRIEKILAQLRDREVAKEEIKTNEAKMLSAEKQRELNEAQAKATAQADLTQSSINIEVADNQGKAALRLAEQDALKIQKLSEAEKFKKQNEADAQKYTKVAQAEADAKTTEMTANADAHKLRVVGMATAENVKAIAEAEAEKETKVGQAKGIAAKALVDAYGGAEIQAMKSVMEAFADALKTGGAAIVPQTVIGGSADGKMPNAMEGIMAMVLANMAKPEMIAKMVGKEES